MKRLQLLLIILFVSLKVCGQNPDDSTMRADVYSYILGEDAEFPGGTEALNKFLEKEIKFPQDAALAKKYGTVYVRFSISGVGTIEDVSVMNGGVYPSLDAEAIRVVKLFPTWKPATYRGQPIISKFVLPVVFNPSSKR
jgi:TonB family protein